MSFLFIEVARSMFALIWGVLFKSFKNFFVTCPDLMPEMQNYSSDGAHISHSFLQLLPCMLYLLGTLSNQIRQVLIIYMAYNDL